MTRRRAANGRSEPWKVRYWGIGNEVYGPWQMGHRSAEQYAADAVEHARFMRAVDPDIKLIGVGIPWNQEAWTDAVLTKAGRYLDYVSLHLYGASNYLWTGDDYENVVSQSLYFEREISSYSQLVTDLASKAGLDAPPAIAMDEWNMRHLEPATWPEPLAGEDGGIAPRETAPIDTWPGGMRVNRWSPRTLADALFYAGVFNTIHRTASCAAPVSMANPVNLVNANALIAARSDGAIRSAIYHIWSLYRHHTGRIVLPSAVDGPARTSSVRMGDDRDRKGEQITAPMTVPYVDVCATRAEDRSIRLAVINRHRTETIRLRPVLDGSTAAVPSQAHIRSLGGDVDDPTVVNTLAEPEAITARDLGRVAADDGTWSLPPHSLTVLTLGGTTA